MSLDGRSWMHVSFCILLGVLTPSAAVPGFHTNSPWVLAPLLAGLPIGPPERAISVSLPRSRLPGPHLLFVRSRTAHSLRACFLRVALRTALAAAPLPPAVHASSRCVGSAPPPLSRPVLDPSAHRMLSTHTAAPCMPASALVFRARIDSQRSVVIVKEACSAARGVALQRTI
ncbi:hypothetical protein FB451DRAFT_1395627 [Mycena latifolia]|nr:hypothetical protein FB451DRAFT_1395627 [Mycena latifolia]